MSIENRHYEMPPPEVPDLAEVTRELLPAIEELFQRHETDSVKDEAGNERLDLIAFNDYMGTYVETVVIKMNAGEPKWVVERGFGYIDDQHQYKSGLERLTQYRLFEDNHVEASNFLRPSRSVLKNLSQFGLEDRSEPLSEGLDLIEYRDTAAYIKGSLPRHNRQAWPERYQDEFLMRD